MDRYEWHVLLYTSETLYVDARDVVSRPITVTTGRNDLTSPVGKAYGQISFLRKELEALIDAEIINPAPIDFGSRIVIYMTDDPLYEFFDGNITDISANAEEITFSFVQRRQFDSTRGNLFEWEDSQPSGFSVLDWLNYIWVNTIDEDPGSVPYINLVPDTAPLMSTEVHPVDGSTSNFFQYADSFLAGIPTGTLSYDTWIPGWIYHFRRIKEVTYEPFIITEEQVVRNYDIQRQIGDVANSVTTDYYLNGVDGFTNNRSGQASRTNQTNVDKIGLRTVRQNTAADQSVISILNAWTLGVQSPKGYPIVEFSTNAELLLKSPTVVAGGYTYRALPFWLFMSGALEASALTGVYDGFADYMWVEQVTHRFDRSKWDIDIIASAAGYTSYPQQWSEVSSTISWDETVLDFPYGEITWDDLLYTTLEPN
jgi:hypothetical protein